MAIVDCIRSAALSLNYPTFLIGGFVRDRLLGRECKDIDVVCLGSGIKLAKTVSDLLPNKPYVTYFKKFGTAMIKTHDFEIEFVGARKESYNRNSRKPIVEDGTLEDDQNRRDFTINAMAIDITENFGNLIDPFQGLADLENKLIRTPHDPNITFSDDPLRMMRAVRFSCQLDFTILPSTFDGIVENNHRIKIVSAERVQDELRKIIMSDRPSKGFLMLYESHLLQYILPELVNLKGIDYQEGQGHKDNFYHTLKVLDNLSKTSQDYWLRWAAILHDIGKAKTKHYSKKLGWTFHNHEIVGSYMVKKVFMRLKLPLDHHLKFVTKMVALHQRPVNLLMDEISDSAIRRLLFDAGEDIDDLITLCTADITSKNDILVKKYKNKYEYLKQRMREVEEKDHLRNWQPPISGEIIMETFKIKPSKTVGDIKNAIKEAILDGKIANNYDEAFAYMLELAGEIGLKS